ncbi:ROK family protein [Streptomyces sp. NBC_01275]|uniref:ROK family protein n=1 Tax=Streptomyces sp. NBC_01275 TaxID=2903807 RepID=UPI00225B0124|nr:ROK family protein [Streptomyces sp. NBC_01275]MCX4761549.1 ROK family protein [Streptomyces sp. NBC_01275]
MKSSLGNRRKRKGKTISYPGSPEYLGIDIGGTKVALRLQNHRGENTAEETFRWPAARDPAADLDLLADRIRSLLARRPAGLAGVGIALPALCNPAGRVLTWPGRPSWAGLDLTAALHRMLPDVPLVHADDGDLAALAEARAADRANVLYLGVGTGVGGGVVHEGRLWPGPGRGSCEIGHLVVDLSGPRCDCGRIGCVQGVASGPATLRRAAALRGRPVDFAELTAAVRAGEPWATSAVDVGAGALAAAAVGVAELARPELIVVGGGFGIGVPGFVESVAARVRELARPGVPPVPVTPAELGGLSSLYGALHLARDAFGPTQAPAHVPLEVARLP